MFRQKSFIARKIPSGASIYQVDGGAEPPSAEGKIRKIYLAPVRRVERSGTERTQAERGSGKAGGCRSTATALDDLLSLFLFQNYAHFSFK